MAVSITHTKVSGKAAGTDSTRVYGTHWDAAHTITNLTIPGSLTLSGAYDLTFTLSATTSLTLPTSGTVATTSNKLSAFASTTSAELAGVISDETGSGSLVFAASPSLTTVSAASSGFSPSSNVLAALQLSGTFGGGIVLTDTAAIGLWVQTSGAELRIGFGTTTLTSAYTLTSSSVAPTTNDAAALGTASLKWSDLHLASGAVVNFNNGDVTLTHSADLLTLAGGGLSLGSTLAVTGATTLSAALTYGGVTLSNAVTGTGNMVLSAGPTLTGTLTAATITASGVISTTNNTAATSTTTGSGIFGGGIAAQGAIWLRNTLYLDKNSAQLTEPSSYAAADNARMVFYEGDGATSYRRYLDIVANGASGSASSHIRLFANYGGDAPVPVAKFDKPTTAAQTSMLIWDVDNATLERVTVGAADSGGAGFKLLRIAN